MARVKSAAVGHDSDDPWVELDCPVGCGADAVALAVPFVSDAPEVPCPLEQALTVNTAPTAIAMSVFLTFHFPTDQGYLTKHKIT